MELLQTAWAWAIEQAPILKTMSSDITKLKWYELIGLIAALLAILVPIWAILKLMAKILFKKRIEPETSSAEEIAKAAISSYEQGQQSLQPDLAQRDQQIEALTKAVEAMQTERQEAETEAEQTTIDTALAHLKEGNTSEAEAIFVAMFEEQSKRGQEANKQAAAAARHIGALAFLHDTDKAIKNYKHATELDPDNADGWNELGHLQDRIGQLDLAIKSYKKVLKLGNKTADQALIAVALTNLGIRYITLGELGNAEKHQLESLKINKSLGNKKGIAINYTILGVIYENRGDLHKAEKAQLKALKINKELNIKIGIADNYGNLGNIYLSGEDLAKAEETHLKSLKIKKQLGHKKGIANSYGSLGNIQFKRGKLQIAINSTLIALEINKQLNDQNGIAACYGNLGTIYTVFSDLDKAENTQLKSLKIKEQLGNKQGMAASYGNLGAIYKLKGNMSEACTHWQKALALFTEVGAKPEIELVSGWLKAANCPDINNPPSN